MSNHINESNRRHIKTASRRRSPRFTSSIRFPLYLDRYRVRFHMAIFLVCLRNSERKLGKRALICLDDITSHGGLVIEGTESSTINGKPIAGVGHKVQCPLCKGVFPIQPDLLGRRYPHRILGRDTAVEGMRTACGAVLIASQSTSTIDDTGEGNSGQNGAATTSTVASAAPRLTPSPTLCLECLKAAAESGATTVMRG